MYKNTEKTFEKIIENLQNFWRKQGCCILQPLDIPVGAGTFHPNTFFGALGRKETKIAYVQPTRRPSDGRYSNNPNRIQHYYQFQVLLKPSPKNIQYIYLKSLEKIGINIKKNDIRFIEDNWENPTLGAWGLGWEIWLNGMEITQFTYFQQIGGFDCHPISIEITYGLERIALHMQKKNTINQIIWHQKAKKNITYGEIFQEFEIENSKYNFKNSNTKNLFNLFEIHYFESVRLIKLSTPLIIPSYEHLLYSNHLFNLLECKKIFSTTNRKDYILKIQEQTKKIAENYLKKIKNNVLI